MVCQTFSFIFVVPFGGVMLRASIWLLNPSLGVEPCLGVFTIFLGVAPLLKTLLLRFNMGI